MKARRTIVPPIKCQGIKTKLVPWIKSMVPPDFDGMWIEPFMGSGVVAFNVIPEHALLADANPHLIQFYKSVSAGSITAASTRLHLETEGAELLRSNGEHYYEIRERFNRRHDPLDFLFLNRACFNGLIRFNRKGEFNVPFCRKPDRFARPYVTKVCNQVKGIADILTVRRFTFVHQDWRDTIHEAQSDDLIYCDPPYIGRHTDYFTNWDERSEIELAQLLWDVSSRFVLSTWHSNKYRKNPFIDRLWSDFHVFTREHFYHIGAREANRNAMREAVVVNYAITPSERGSPIVVQERLLERPSHYGYHVG